MKKYLFIVILFIIPSIAWGTCTYTAGTISCPVGATTDDWPTGSANVYLPYSYGSSYTVRFNPSIPVGATVTSATVSFKASYLNANSCTNCAKVSLCDSDSLSAPTAHCTPTGSATTYNVGSWTIGTRYDSGNFASIANAWIARPGYEYGNYLGLLFESTGTATTHSFTSAYTSPSSDWPILSISFTGGDPVLSAVYMADPYVRSKQYLYPQLYNTTATQKLKTYIDDVLVDTKTNIAGQSANGEEKILVDYTSLTAGEHTLRMVVTDASDVEYSSTEWTRTWTTTHDGTPYSSLNEDNAFVLGGNKIFPIAEFLWNNDSDNLDVPNAGDIWTDWFNTKWTVGNASTIALGQTGYANSSLPYAIGPNSYFSAFSQTAPRYSALDCSFSETFEGAGTPATSGANYSQPDTILETSAFSWTTSGTVDFVDTSDPLVGTKSLKVTNGYAQLALNNPYSKVAVKFLVKGKTRSGASDLVAFVDDEGTVLGKVIVNASNNLEVHHCSGGSCTGDDTDAGTFTFADNTLYYVWAMHDTAPLSAALQQGSISVYISTTSTKPSAADAGITMTGAGVGAIKYIRFSASADNALLYDNIQDDLEDVKEWWTALKSTETYPRLIAWIWDDEPDMGGEEDYNIYFPEWRDYVMSLDTERPVVNGLYGSNYNLLASSGNTYKSLRSLYVYNKDYYGYNRMVADAIAVDLYFHEYGWYKDGVLASTSATGIEWQPRFDNYIDSLDYVINGVYGLIPVSNVYEPNDLQDCLCSAGSVYAFPCTSNARTMNVPVGSVSGTFTSSTNSAPKYVRFGGDNTKVAELLEVRLNEGTDADHAYFKITYPRPHSVYNSHFVIHALNSTFNPDALANTDAIVDCTSITGTYGSVTCTATGSNTAQVITGDTSKVPYLGGTVYKYRPMGSACSYRRWSPMPTAQGLKNTYWLALVHGSKMILNFNRHSAFSYQHSTEMKAVKDLLDGAIGQALLGPVDTTKFTVPTANKGGWASATVATGGRVDYTVRTDSTTGTTYIFAARVKKWAGDAAENIAATFDITGLSDDTTITVYGEDRTITSDSGSFTDPAGDGTGFDYHDVHIYTYGGTPGDTTAPAITGFVIPGTAESLTVDITTFTCTDAVGVTGYCTTEANSATSCAWSASAPASHVFGSTGAHTLYGFCKDAAGNISASSNDSVTITLPDADAPTITGFVIPSTAQSLTVPITTFTCTDVVGVTGYCTTQINDSSGCSWSASAPETYTFNYSGSNTLYAFCKDDAGNISSSSNDSVTIGIPYYVTPSTNMGCILTPSDMQSVASEGTQEFTVTSSQQYYIVSVSGCSGSMSGSTFTTGAISGDCTVTAVCKQLPLHNYGGGSGNKYGSGSTELWAY